MYQVCGVNHLFGILYINAYKRSKVVALHKIGMVRFEVKSVDFRNDRHVTSQLHASGVRTCFSQRWPLIYPKSQ